MRAVVWGVTWEATSYSHKRYSNRHLPSYFSRSHERGRVAREPPFNGIHQTKCAIFESGIFSPANFPKG
jgi:hypothetical protein